MRAIDADMQLRVFFDSRLTLEDQATAGRIMGGWRDPDLIIAPDGNPYLYRWHIVPRSPEANIYLHVQVTSDPERPLHDHPWDNQSVILAGGYDEHYNPDPAWWDQVPIKRHPRKGDVVQRKAEEAHRLELPPGIPYTMSLFSTGPKRRNWGFWYPDGWRPFEDVTRTENGKSVHIKSEAM